MSGEVQAELVRKELAALLAEGLGIPVAAFVPSTLRTASGYLEPLDPYQEFIGEPATFKRPVLRVKLVLVSPAVDWERAMPWIDRRVHELRVCLAPRALVGGALRPTLTTVRSLGVVDTKSLAFECALTPIHLGEIE